MKYLSIVWLEESKGWSGVPTVGNSNSSSNSRLLLCITSMGDGRSRSAFLCTVFGFVNINH